MIYLLAINIQNKNDFDIYIQLRDKDMRLLYFFNLCQIKEYFEEKNLDYLYVETNISDIIKNISIDKIQKLNYNN